MVKNKKSQDETQADDGDEQPPGRYFVDAGQAADAQRALAILIGSRRCYTCQNTDEDAPKADSKPGPYISRIAEHCEQTSDYLAPDTPIREAIFRVILARRNKLTTANEISDTLTEKWAATAYPRDTSAAVIQRLLDRGGFYSIGRMPDPKVKDKD